MILDVLILMIIVIGMVAGWLAHLIIEKDSPLDWPALFIAGLIGSFVGGTLLNLLTGDGLSIAPSGLLGSVVGAVIVLAIANAAGMRKRPARRTR